MREEIVLKRIINRGSYIVVEIEAINNLQNYKKALELIDNIFGLTEDWELLQQKYLDEYKLKVKRIFYKQTN